MVEAVGGLNFYMQKRAISKHDPKSFSLKRYGLRFHTGYQPSKVNFLPKLDHKFFFRNKDSNKEWFVKNHRQR